MWVNKGFSVGMHQICFAFVFRYSNIDGDDSRNIDISEELF